jgi:hypothetical protein
MCLALICKAHLYSYIYGVDELIIKPYKINTMEQHYMLMIWKVIGAKENQNLTVKEQQDKIVEILSLMKKDVQDFTKNDFKKQCVKAVEASLNAL